MEPRLPAQGSGWFFPDEYLDAFALPHAVQIVDWYHASEYLPPIAEAVFGQDTPAYHAWLDQMRTQLWEGQIDALIHDCLLFVANPSAANAVQRAVSYFTNNQKRMDYARFRQLGYFIGYPEVSQIPKLL